MILSAPATLLMALVTLLAILVAIGTALLVVSSRRKHGVAPPAMGGPAPLERALRVQGNTVEQFVVFLPALWLAAIYFQGWIPPVVGLIWCAGRVIYAVGYMTEPNKRLPGFAICILSTLALVVLAAVGIVLAWGAA